jgi:hypothetical protein
LGRKSNGKSQTKIISTPPTLNGGDIICPKCEGHGFVDHQYNEEWETQCDKCWGAGKLDWIERIMGKAPPRPRTLKGNWTIEMEKDLVSLHHYDLDDEILAAMGREIADKVDEEIMENIVEFSVTKSKLR